MNSSRWGSSMQKKKKKIVGLRKSAPCTAGTIIICLELRLQWDIVSTNNTSSVTQKSQWHSSITMWPSFPVLSNTTQEKRASLHNQLTSQVRMSCISIQCQQQIVIHYTYQVKHIGKTENKKEKVVLQLQKNAQQIQCLYTWKKREQKKEQENMPKSKQRKKTGVFKISDARWECPERTKSL